MPRSDSRFLSYRIGTDRRCRPRPRPRHRRRRRITSISTRSFSVRDPLKGRVQIPISVRFAVRCAFVGDVRVSRVPTEQRVRRVS